MRSIFINVALSVEFFPEGHTQIGCRGSQIRERGGGLTIFGTAAEMPSMRDFQATSKEGDDSADSKEGMIAITPTLHPTNVEQSGF